MSGKTSKLQKWIQTWQSEIETVAGVIIGVIVAWFTIVKIIKAVSFFGQSKLKEGIVELVYAALIVLIGILGYVGVKKLLESILPESDILTGAISFLPMF